MAGGTVIHGDQSFDERLASEVTIESDGTILEANLGLADTAQKTWLLVVDTGVYYHYYKGIWYPQNASPIS